MDFNIRPKLGSDLIKTETLFDTQMIFLDFINRSQIGEVLIYFMIWLDKNSIYMIYLFLVAIFINICRSLKFTELQWLQFISVWSEEARRDPESYLSQKFRTAYLFDDYSPIKNNNIDDYPSASNLTITLNIRLSLCNWENHYISNILNIYST